MKQRIEAKVDGEWCKVYFMSNDRVAVVGRLQERFPINEVTLRVVEDLSSEEILEQIAQLEHSFLIGVAHGIVLEETREEIRRLYEELSKARLWS